MKSKDWYVVIESIDSKEVSNAWKLICANEMAIYLKLAIKNEQSKYENESFINFDIELNAKTKYGVNAKIKGEQFYDETDSSAGSDYDLSMNHIEDTEIYSSDSSKSSIDDSDTNSATSSSSFGDEFDIVYCPKNEQFYVELIEVKFLLDYNSYLKFSHHLPASFGPKESFCGQYQIKPNKFEKSEDVVNFIFKNHKIGQPAIGIIFNNKTYIGGKTI